MLHLRTLGTLAVTGSNGHELEPVLTQPKRLALLAYLAVATPRGFHRRDTLLALFWPDSDESRARAALSRAVYYLRSTLGESVIVGRGDQELGLSEKHIHSDAAAFSDAVDEGRWADALEFYKGELLEGLLVSETPEFDRWLSAERERFRGQAARAAAELAAAAEAGGDLETASAAARRGVELAPYDESALRHLVSLLDRAGNRAEAMRAYEELAGRLANDLDVEPSPETQQLIEEIRRRTDANGAASSDSGELSSSALLGERVGHSVEAARTGVEAAIRADRSEPEPPRRRTLRWFGPSVAALVVVTVASVTWSARTGRSAGGASERLGAISSLAVQPIRVVGESSEAGLFPEGLTEDLTTRLSQLRSLRVVSRQSSARFSGSDTSPAQLGRQLGVDAVVSGTVQHDGSQLRTTARLVDARTGEVLWTRSYDSEPAELLEVQRDIALSVAAAVHAVVSRGEQERLQRSGSVDLTAWEYAERGRMLVQEAERWTEELESQTTDLLTKALALEPDYPPAHAALALVYRRRVWLPHDDPARYDSARAAASEAISLDDEHFLGHHALGHTLLASARPAIAESWQDMRAQGFAALLRAAELNPSYAPTLNLLGVGPLSYGHRLLWRERAHRIDQNWIAAYPMRGWHLWMLGDFERAVRAFRSALELEPVDPYHRQRLAQIYLAQGRLELARSEIAAVTTTNPDFADILAEAFVLAVREGDLIEAETLARQAVTRGHRYPLLGDRPHMALSSFFPETGLAYVLQRTDRDAQARSILEGLAQDLSAFVERSGPIVCDYELARVHALLGDREAAVEWIERAVDRGWWLYHHLGFLDPMLESIHDEPRFMAAMGRVGAILDAERAFVEEVEVLSETEQLERLLADERARLEELRGQG